jgi:hypothetical protein
MRAESFVLGLSTGGVCLAHCLPSAFPFLSAGNMTPGKYSGRVLVFIAGRLMGYLIFGFMLGSMDYLTVGLVSSALFSYSLIVINILMGILLLTYGIVYQFPKLNLCGKITGHCTEHISTLVLGVLTGISLRPPLITAATNAYCTLSSLTGMIYFLFIFLGTTIYMLPLFGIPLFKKYRKQINIVSRFALIFSGVYYLFFKGVILLCTTP